LFASLGAHVLQSDDRARADGAGQGVYTAIADHFGKGVVQQDGGWIVLHWRRSHSMTGGFEELNAIVHPAVIARQAELSEAIFQQDRRAIVMVEVRPDL